MSTLSRLSVLAPFLASLLYSQPVISTPVNQDANLRERHVDVIKRSTHLMTRQEEEQDPEDGDAEIAADTDVLRDGKPPLTHIDVKWIS